MKDVGDRDPHDDGDRDQELPAGHGALHQETGPGPRPRPRPRPDQRAKAPMQLPESEFESCIDAAIFCSSGRAGSADDAALSLWRLRQALDLEGLSGHMLQLAGTQPQDFERPGFGSRSGVDDATGNVDHDHDHDPDDVRHLRLLLPSRVSAEAAGRRWDDSTDLSPGLRLAALGLIPGGLDLDSSALARNHRTAAGRMPG